MKTRKIVALVLSASMVMGVFAGCSKVKKVSLKDMDKAAEKVDAGTIEIIEEMDDLEDIDFDDDDYEDGVYISVTADAMEEIKDEIPDEQLDGMTEALDALDIDFDIDDVQDMGIYMKREDESNMAIVAYIDCGNEELAGDLFNDLLDACEDVDDELQDALEEMELDETEYFEDFEFNLENLSKKEFYFNGSDKGYLKLRLAKDDMEVLFDEDIPQLFEDFDADIDEDDFEDQVDEMLDEMPFDVAAVGVYFNGSSIVVTMVMSDDEDFIADYETFMKTLGLEAPSKVELSEYGRKLFVTAIFAGAGSYMTKAQNVSSMIEF